MVRRRRGDNSGTPGLPSAAGPGLDLTPPGAETRPEPASAPALPRPEPGGRVRILTSHDDGDGLSARVVRADGDRLLLQLHHNEDGRGRGLAAGVEIQLLLGRAEAAYLFQAAVLARPDDGVVAVGLAGHPLRIQRREFFRLAVRLPIAVRLPNAVPLPVAVHVSQESSAEEPQSDRAEMFDDAREGAPAPAAAVGDSASGGEAGRPDPEIRIFRLADLSAGGCLCLDPGGALRRGLLYPASLELHDGEPPLAVRVEVVRRGVSFGYPSAGLRFVAFPERDRERVMRTLFREYRERTRRIRS